MFTVKLMKLLLTDRREPIPGLKMRDPRTDFSPHAFGDAGLADGAVTPQAPDFSEDDAPVGF